MAAAGAYATNAEVQHAVNRLAAAAVTADVLAPPLAGTPANAHRQILERLRDTPVDTITDDALLATVNAYLRMGRLPPKERVRPVEAAHRPNIRGDIPPADRLNTAWAAVTAAGVAPQLEASHTFRPAAGQDEHEMMVRCNQVVARLISPEFRNALQTTVLNEGDLTQLLGLANGALGQQNLGMRLNGGPNSGLGAAIFEGAFSMLFKYGRERDSARHAPAKETLKLINKVFKRLVAHAVAGYLFLNPNGHGVMGRLAIKGNRAYYVHNPGSLKPKSIGIKLQGDGAIQSSKIPQYELTALQAALPTGGLEAPYQFVFCMMKYCPAYMRWSSRMNRGERRKARLAKARKDIRTQFANQYNSAAIKAMKAGEEALKMGGGVKSKRKQAGPVGGCI